MSSNSLSYIHLQERERERGEKKNTSKSQGKFMKIQSTPPRVRTLDVWHQASPSPWYWAFRRVYASRSSVSLENSGTKPQGERRDESQA